MKIADGANITLRLPEITIPDGANLVSTNIVVATNLAENVNFDVSRITCDLSCVKTSSGNVPRSMKLVSSGTGISISIMPYFCIKVR